jgi:hypothetical protein
VLPLSPACVLLDDLYDPAHETTDVVAMTDGHTPNESQLALFVLRVASPSLVLLTTLALIFARPSPPKAPSEITQVVVATRTPRRGLILSLLSLISLTFLLDGLTFVVHAVITKHWPQVTGIEINSLVGLIAFSGLAALGTYKDIKGVHVWTRASLKFAILCSLVLNIAQVVLFWFTLVPDSACPIVLLLVFPEDGTVFRTHSDDRSAMLFDRPVLAPSLLEDPDISYYILAYRPCELTMAHRQAPSVPPPRVSCRPSSCYLPHTARPHSRSPHFRSRLANRNVHGRRVIQQC